jgi:hypothetical protein
MLVQRVFRFATGQGRDLAALRAPGKMFKHLLAFRRRQRLLRKRSEQVRVRMIGGDLPLQARARDGRKAFHIS